MRGDGEEREREKLGERKREQALKERCRAGRAGAGAVERNDASHGLHLNPRVHPHIQCIEGQDDKQDVMRT